MAFDQRGQTVGNQYIVREVTPRIITKQEWAAAVRMLKGDILPRLERWVRQSTDDFPEAGELATRIHALLKEIGEDV